MDDDKQKEVVKRHTQNNGVVVELTVERHSETPKSGLTPLQHFKEICEDRRNYNFLRNEFGIREHMNNARAFFTKGKYKVQKWGLVGWTDDRNRNPVLYYRMPSESSKWEGGQA